MKNRPSPFGIGALVAITALGCFTTAAQAQVNLIYYPNTPFVFDENNVVGVTGDGAPGFASGSFASDGTGKTDIHFYVQSLFPSLSSVALGDIKNISFWTKKDSTHAADVVDWALVIYTQPYDNDVSTSDWYGDRIGAEPYFAININDPANTWNQWSTDGSQNQLRFYESTLGYFGSSSDPTWDTFVAQNALSSEPYAGHDILYLAIDTGSGTADDFFGQVDGFRIELNDGKVGTVNFEAVPEPATYAAFMGLAVLGIVGFKRFRRRKQTVIA